MKDITFRNSMKYGDLTTKLSLLILGLGNFRGRQIIKGILYIALEAAFIIFMIIKGISCLAGLPGLGSRILLVLIIRNLILFFGVATVCLQCGYYSKKCLFFNFGHKESPEKSGLS